MAYLRLVYQKFRLVWYVLMSNHCLVIRCHNAEQAHQLAQDVLACHQRLQEAQQILNQSNPQTPE